MKKTEQIPNSINDAAAYYRKFPWQLFCTFTFLCNLRNGDAEARWRWSRFIDELEHLHGDTIGRLVAEESRHAHGALSGIRLHYHALFVSNRPPSQVLMRDLWKKYCGNGKNLIDIKAYDPSKHAVEYCLKLHGSFNGEIDIQNLDLYAPERPIGWNRNCWARRRWRRQLERQAQGIAA